MALSLGTASSSGTAKRDTTPRFSLEQAKVIAEEHYGLAIVELRPLSSERDQNFQLRTYEGTKLVLKISNCDVDIAVLELQGQAVKHLRQRVRDLGLPETLPALNGADISRTEDPQSGREFYVRLVTWLDGELLVNAKPHTEGLLASLGAQMAQMADAFSDFTHPAMDRRLKWDLPQIAQALEHLALVEPTQQKIVEHFMRIWDRVAWKELRRSVIHGDANDYNVIVNEGRVTGMIDFGDTVRSATICDLAIAIAYAVLDKPRPLDALATIVSAYHRLRPLTEPEIEALLPLVTMRLCMSVCYAANNAREKRGDEYQLVSSAPAWRLLDQLCEIDIEQAARTVNEACQDKARLLERRWKHIGQNVRLSYRAPLWLRRGDMQYVYDESGRRFLDAYNNVPHVGHCHPAVVAAATFQLQTLNTNTRYLHEGLSSCAELLTSQLPPSLTVCYFVNSGSEANELALRLARAATGAKDLIVLDHAYHGNTTTLIDISPYKHGSRRGHEAPDWVHVAELPDLYRGRYVRANKDAGRAYANSVLAQIANVAYAGRTLCGFIAESWPSVAGQMDLPDGYLPIVYESVRASGGVCIADEVQTAYGRLGFWFWGFEKYNVVPDIVVLGKSIGNGYPIGAVITTRAIADAFDTGMEYFSTYGGSTVSCAVGRAVLDIVIKDELTRHAREVGAHLEKGLKYLMERHSSVGDVRGSGLFWGVEIVLDRETRAPATSTAKFVVNYLRERGVLIGSDGVYDQVLKIRPPMPFDAKNAEQLLEVLDEALSDADKGR